MLGRILLALILFAFAREAVAACPDAIVRRDNLFRLASYRLADAGGQVLIRFVGHGTFLIQSPEGVRVITDYTDLVPIKGLGFVPDIITMNHFHITHFSNYPDPLIKHVLRGWAPEGGVARNDLRLKDMRVRSIQTNFGERGNLTSNENSVFVFEVANMCIAHLSHTHHILTKAELAELGEIDVLLVPVDGMFTLSPEEVMDSIEKVKPKLVIPWHYSYWTTRFIADLEKLYKVRKAGSSSITVSKTSLPETTQVVFLDEEIVIRGWSGFPGGPQLPGFSPGGRFDR
jgi:L-ascorbate metabolism protein UlaG (beta-lactamase superfamily)